MGGSEARDNPWEGGGQGRKDGGGGGGVGKDVHSKQTVARLWGPCKECRAGLNSDWDPEILHEPMVDCRYECTVHC